MFKYLNKDLPASLVVFFVALPLCLGIALASGAPLFSGLIAGMIGGIVVGSISGSSLGVSGPAAGLAVIVLGAIQVLGSFENFLLAVVLAGGIQIILGLLKAGIIGYYFPSSVIKGMLAGIGITIIIQQLPNILGLSDSEGIASIHDPGEGIYFSLANMGELISYGALILTLIALAVLLLWDKVLSKKHQLFKLIPGSLVAVVIGIIYYLTVPAGDFALSPNLLVNVPVPDNVDSFFGQFSTPNFSMIGDPQIWIIALTIAVVASLETLLSVEAVDKIDPRKRMTPTNRELFAQGSGNILSGLIGGLPITQVIVRSSANVHSGGRTKLSTILHGFLILISIIAIPTLLNLIPLAILSAILLIVGYKLSSPSLYVKMFSLGKSQFMPFIITVLGVVFSDLLVGIGLGLVVGITVILINSYKNSHFLQKEKNGSSGNKYRIILAEEVTFLNKGGILKELYSIPKNSHLEIDVQKTKVLDYDIIEILDEFKIKARNNDIEITLVSERGNFKNPESYYTFFRKKITA